MKALRSDARWRNVFQSASGAWNNITIHLSLFKLSWNPYNLRLTLDISWHNTVFEPGEVWIASEKLWRACGNKQTRENLCRSSVVRKIEPVVVSSRSFAEALWRLEMFTVSRSCKICIYIYTYIQLSLAGPHNQNWNILITKQWPGSGYHAVHTSVVRPKSIPTYSQLVPRAPVPPRPLLP